MFRPDDPLKPRDAVFDEAWHAQTLALADTMVQAGIFSADDWALALGAALKQADAKGESDTTETYYHCAINTLEQLVARNTAIDQPALNSRKASWERAYLATPHGQPVSLTKRDNTNPTAKAGPSFFP
ncbi:MAG: nitrile hydratase accessory protein [Paracoccaceae bacterium]